MAPLTADDLAKRGERFEARSSISAPPAQPDPPQTQPAPATGGLDMALLEKETPSVPAVAADADIEDGGAEADGKADEVQTVEEYGLLDFLQDLRWAAVGFGLCTLVLAAALLIRGPPFAELSAGSPGHCALKGGALLPNDSFGLLFQKSGKLSVDALEEHCWETCRQERTIRGCQLAWVRVPTDQYWLLEDAIYRDAVNFSITPDECPGYGCSTDGLCATAWADQDNENQTCAVHCVFRVVTNVPINESSQHGSCSSLTDGNDYPKTFNTGDVFSNEQVRWAATASHCGLSSGFHMCLTPGDEVQTFSCAGTYAAVSGAASGSGSHGGALCWQADPAEEPGAFIGLFGVGVGFVGACLFCFQISQLVDESTATKPSRRGLQAFADSITVPTKLSEVFNKLVAIIQKTVAPKLERAVQRFQQYGISGVYVVVLLNIIVTTSSGLIQEDNPETRKSPIFIIMMHSFFRVVLISLAVIMMNCSRHASLHGVELGFMPPIILILFKGGATRMFGASFWSNLCFILLLVVVLLEVLPLRMRWSAIISVGSYSLLSLRLLFAACHPVGWGITYANRFTWMITGMTPSLYMAMGLFALETVTIFELRRWAPPRAAVSAEGIRIHSSLMVACSTCATVYAHCSSEGGFASGNATIFFWTAALVYFRHCVLMNSEVSASLSSVNSLAADAARPWVDEVLDKMVRKKTWFSWPMLVQLWEALGRWRWRLGFMMASAFFKFLALAHALLEGSLSDDENGLVFTPLAAACTGMILSAVAIVFITCMLLVDAGYPGFYVDEGFRLIVVLGVFHSYLQMIALFKVSGPFMVPSDVLCDTDGVACPLEDAASCFRLASSWCPAGQLLTPTCSDPVVRSFEGTDQLRCPDTSVTFARVWLVASCLLSWLVHSCVMAVECQPASAAAARRALLRKASTREIDKSSLGKKLFACFTRAWNRLMEADWSRVIFWTLWVSSAIGYLTLLAGALLGGAGSVLAWREIGEIQVADEDSCTQLLFLTFGFAMVFVLVNEYGRVEEAEESPEEKLAGSLAGTLSAHSPDTSERTGPVSLADNVRSLAGAVSIFAFAGVVIFVTAGFTSTGMGWAAATGTVSLTVACMASVAIAF